ncbi:MULTISPECIES: APC family permease [Clostridium]|uniref:Putrescine importer PuuP n=2 Tax=Clostridium TaxID=1485 RepID=A0A1A6AW00_9CLOT|nr:MULTISPECIES: APC family permease [Clostridium]OBR94213.1 putrescine importer PuuP [Clostridium ragsdalei P11]QXE18242.1 amino acid permease [Clostridium sp. 001]RMD01051.1 APC family permease [Clostridium autoethanogenum]
MEKLRQNELSYLEVVALPVAMIAPSSAMALNVPLMASICSYSVSLVFLISIVLLGCIAVSFVKFNQYFSTAGSVYTFTTESLGKKVGCLSGWAIYLTYSVFTAGCLSAFGSMFNDLIATSTGINIGWIPYTIVALFLSWYLCFSDVKLSSKIMLILEFVSIFLIIILAIVVISKTGFSTIPFKINKNSPSNIGEAIVFAILCFAGFEGASSYGEESKNPKKTIPLAIASTVIMSGLFFVLTSYALVLGFSHSKDGIAALAKSPSSVADLSKMYMPTFYTYLTSFVVSLSAFSAGLGAMAAASRLFYSMSQDGNVPKIISKVHPKHKTPYVSLNVLLIFSLLLVFLLSKNDGTIIFGYCGTLGAMSLLIAYFITCLGSIVYFKHNKIWTNKDLIFPIIALVVLAYTFYANIYPVPAFPNNIFPYIILIWYVLGYSFTLIYKSKTKNQEFDKDKIAL